MLFLLYVTSYDCCIVNGENVFPFAALYAARAFLAVSPFLDSSINSLDFSSNCLFMFDTISESFSVIAGYEDASFNITEPSSAVTSELFVRDVIVYESVRVSPELLLFVSC